MALALAREASCCSRPSPTYPVLDAVESNTDVSERSTLDGLARKRLRRGKAPIVIPSLEVDPSRVPVLGSYVPGDIVRVRGGYGLASIDSSHRITEFKVTVDDSGGETATVNFANLEVQ
jgi:hypothetical protein